MNPGYLALFPTAIESPVNTPELITRLTEIQLIGSPVSGHSDRFYTGAHFLQLITFMGCSPAIPLEKGTDDKEPCILRFWGPYQSPRLFTGGNSRPPRCPLCRNVLKEWRSALERQENNPIECPECSKLIDVERLNWRQLAGVGRQFLTISQVFPGEAVPVGGLMRCLEGEGEPWDYCYIQEPLQLTPINRR
ncbi:MAG: hypothetical protein OQL20_12800 [Sedimenticola sp.]|nr:hypothetical protein [Sedimenticola sp.]